MDFPSIKKRKKFKMSKSCKALLTLLGKDEKKAEIELGKCDVESLKPEDQQKVLDFHKKLFCTRFNIDSDTDKQGYCKVSTKSQSGAAASTPPPSTPSVSSLAKKLESLPLTIPTISDVGASSGPNRPAPKLSALPQTGQQSSDTGASSGPSRPAPKLTALPSSFQQPSNVGASSGGGRNVVGNMPGRHTEGS